MSAQPDKLSVSAAASLLNISASSVQRLCNRGLLAYETTSGGHRRIAWRDLSLLLEQLRGKSPETLAPQPAPILTLQEIQNLLLCGAAQELLEWLRVTDSQLQSVVDKLENGLHAAIVDLDTMFLAGQLSTHRMWLAVNTARTLLERTSSRIAIPSAQPSPAIGGSPAGTQAELGIRFVEVGLRLCGLDAIGLGTNLDPGGLAEAARHLTAQIVWVCHTHIASVSETIRWHRALKDKLQPHVRVLIGGGALSPSIRRQLPPHTYYESIAAMVASEHLQFATPVLAGPHFQIGPSLSTYVQLNR